ncbi:MAG: pentapeptide repeat-containing protein [Lentisphaeraceae bacterium]|nr:pentapeptide repeat-containing protein [Lentisphaeraceae bacterium]
MEITTLSSIAITLIFLAVVLGLFYWLYFNPSKKVDLETSLSSAEKHQLKNQFRAASIQLLGGFSFLIGIWLTWQELKTDRARLEINYQVITQAQKSEQEKQVTDQFLQAIRLLKEESLMSRIGAIYAFDRIKTNSPQDSRVIMEVLSAYVREQHPINRNNPVKSDIIAIFDLFSRIDLQPNEVNFINLSNCNFEGLDLPRLNLAGANLSNTNFKNSTLINSNFSGATLKNTNFNNAVLTNANFDRADLSMSDFSGVDFSYTSLRNTSLLSSNLTGSRLFNANISGGDLRLANLTKANLGGAILKKTDFRGAQVFNAIMEGSILDNADLRGANFSKTNLREAKIRSASLSNVNFANVNFSGADLSSSSLKSIKNLTTKQLIVMNKYNPNSLDQALKAKLEASQANSQHSPLN